MTTEWRDVLLEELAEDVTVGFVGPMASEYVPQGIPFLRSQNVEPLLVNDSDLKFITPTFHERLRKSALSPGDVVIVRTGKPGACAVIPSSLPVANCSDLVIVRCGPELDARFLAYYVNSVAVHHVDSHLVGAVQQHFNVGSARKLLMHLPPVTEQRAIAHILGTLDDKIELNRRMNETLEAMARALFKSWFVDFDPVRAKAEGRDPGLPKPLAALFSDSFEGSELGQIPKGWEVGRLGDVLDQRVERCDASADTAARPYVPIDCISSRSLFLAEIRPGVEAQSSLTRFYKGDLLFGAMRPYFHKVCIAPFDGTTRTTAFVLFPRAKEDFAFATLLLHHPDTIDYATRHSTGSTIPYAVWSNSLEEMPVILPPSEARRAFDGVVRPMLGRIPEPYFQNQTLAALRDTLLPKLISGELRVKNVARFAGPVV
jgi:type I restriction enzyme S subunit